jgi:enamine deaminase RidA (YjgF/YER057c/UK114 family)
VIEKSNPPGIHVPPGYHHVTVADARRTVHLAGQSPLDAAGELVGPDDLVAQVGQVVRNIEIGLASVGASADDVVRTVIYVASPEQADLVLVWAALQASSISSAFTTASTLLGVAQLGYSGQLVEVDVTAALP